MYDACHWYVQEDPGCKAKDSLRPLLPHKNNNNTQLWSIKPTALNTAPTHFVLTEWNIRGFSIFTLLDRWDISFYGNKYISWQMRFLQSRRSFQESTIIMNSIKKTIMKLKGGSFISRHVILYFDVLAAWKSSGFSELSNFRCLFKLTFRRLTSTIVDVPNR